MKKLFAIRRPHSKSLVKHEDGHVLFFSDKMKAKKVRNALNEERDGHTIALGPDHRRHLKNNGVL